MRKKVLILIFLMFIFIPFSWVNAAVYVDDGVGNSGASNQTECSFSDLDSVIANSGRIYFGYYDVIQRAKSSSCRLVLPVCSYENSDKSTKVIIDYQYKDYYVKNVLDPISRAGYFWFFRKDENKDWTSFGPSGAGSYNIIKPNFKNFGASVDDLYCPKYINIDKKGNVITGSDTSGSYTRIDAYGVFGQTKILALQAIEEVDYNIYSAEYMDFKDYIITQTKFKLFDYHKIQGNQVSFLNDYFDDNRTKGITYDLSNYKDFVSAYNKKVDEMIASINDRLNKGEITSEEAEDLINHSVYFDGGQANEDTSNNFPELDNNDGDTPNNGDANQNCTSLLGDLTPIVENILRTVQYAGPVLVAIFTIIDFAKASLNDSAGDMKKNYSKLIKRLIAAILLFFIPLLINLIFTIAGITTPDNCINI